MVTRLTRIAPLQLAVVLAILYAFLGILFALLTAPMMAMMAAFGGRMVPPGFSFGFAALIMFPITYGVIGFIGGLIWAGLYNVVAGWLGGIELTFSTAAPNYVAPESNTLA